MSDNTHTSKRKATPLSPLSPASKKRLSETLEMRPRGRPTTTTKTFYIVLKTDFDDIVDFVLFTDDKDKANTKEKEIARAEEDTNIEVYNLSTTITVLNLPEPYTDLFLCLECGEELELHVTSSRVFRKKDIPDLEKWHKLFIESTFTEIYQDERFQLNSIDSEDDDEEEFEKVVNEDAEDEEAYLIERKRHIISVQIPLDLIDAEVPELKTFVKFKML